MSTCSNHTGTNTKQIEHLLWPPKHMLSPNITEGERIDLLAYLDAEVYNTRGSYPLKLPYGVTILRDRVVLEQERFSSPSRDHQTALASQFQASFAEQGFAVVVKEWANPTQKRSILRVRLKCRFAGCKFHFQINWDQNMGYWFISRRRCGIFQHSCRTQEGGNAAAEGVARPNHSHNHHKRPHADSPPPMYAPQPPSNKRARLEGPQADPRAAGSEQPFLVTPQVNGSQAHSLRTVSHGESSPGAPAPKPPVKESAAMDFAESLLSLSKGKTSGSQQDDESSTEGTKEPTKREPSPKVKSEERPPRGEQHHHYPVAVPSAHPNVRTRPIVLGEIPHGTQAFAQMANTMGHNLYSHLVHGRGEMSLTMSFDGEGFVLRTSVPSGPPPALPHPPQHHQPPPQVHHPHDPKSAAARGSGPMNYPYLPPQRFQPPARSDPAVVML